MELVERTVTLPTDLEGAWALITQPDAQAGWLGAEVDLHPSAGAAGQVVDHDGTTRHLVVEQVDEHRRLSWRWWGDDDAVSEVEVTLAPAEGGTRLTVVERAPAEAGAATARASVASEAWSHRLLHLEALLLVAAAVRG